MYFFLYVSGRPYYQGQKSEHKSSGERARALKIFVARFYKEKLFHIINRDKTNNLLYKVLACVNPTKWHELEDASAVSEWTITANATGDADDYQTSTESWAFYKIQCKSSAGKVEVYGEGRK